MSHGKNKQFRILQLMLSTQEGGAENFCEKLTLAFDERGIEQKIIIEPFPTREERLNHAQNLVVDPIKFGGINRLFAKQKLRRSIDAFDPNIIITWMNRASRRVPAGLPYPVIGRLGGYYKLRYYKNCSHLVGITPDLLHHIRENGWPDERSSLIPNFGETPRPLNDPAIARHSMRSEHDIPSDAPVILALGRLHEVKAHDILLKSLANIDKAHLLLAGDGPLRSFLENLAIELGISDRVHFLGWRNDVAQLFATADISVFPSRYEPNGTVIMESWAHQTPLIASRSKGAEWLVDNDKNGLLFPIDDVSGLQKSIERLIHDPTLSKTLVSGGNEKFSRSFSKEKVVDAYLTLFTSLLKDG